jgi:hypothetical protein
MRRNISVYVMIFVVLLISSCNNPIKSAKDTKTKAVSKILQQKDGSISLKVEKADCYSDMINPASNTAEWNVIVSKSGRYDVWLSSATKDTTNLNYKNSVMLSIRDNRLEAKPGCDNIVLNSNEVSFPYFRADSFIGSLFIQDTGLVSIQLISEKILPKDYKSSESSATENSKFLSVFLTPISR